MEEFVFDYNQYKKRLQKKFSLPISIIVIVIIVLIFLAITIKPTTQKKRYFYFVEVNAYFNYNQANQLAQEIKSSNGAGYIHFDGKYHVLASFYPDKNSATTVVDNIKEQYPTAKIYEIETYKVIKNAKTSVKDFVTAMEDVINKIYNLSLDYDKHQISNERTTLEAKQIYNNMVKKTQDFSTLLKSDKKQVTQFTTLDSIITTISSLQTVDEEYSQKIKYSLIKIVVNYSSLLSSLNS